MVHATEASLNQAFNLVLAYGLHRLFRVGRSSSVRDLGSKLASCAVVSLGLFGLALLGGDEGADEWGWMGLDGGDEYAHSALGGSAAALDTLGGEAAALDPLSGLLT